MEAAALDHEAQKVSARKVAVVVPAARPDVNVSDLALESLARIATLRDLNLSFTSVSDRGLAHLAPLDKMRRLILAMMIACRTAA